MQTETIIFSYSAHSDSNEVRLVTREYRYTNEEAQSQIDLFTAIRLLENLGTLLDPSWSELELRLSGDKFLRCDLNEWGVQLFIRGLGGSRLTTSDKEVTKQDLLLKGGDRGACKLLGDVMVMLERISNKLREAVRIREGYFNELQISNNSNEVAKNIEIMRRMQIDDIQTASRLMLTTREMKTKVHGTDI
ncbi:hypothetical protein Tco_0992032 [Tanacetum coccineum]|uniref:Uncharacterized protein n=1 Tax=Tanacetum coccineum TaxID=301880 RepID=A0ABQ5F1N1_9ASTR